MDKCIEYDRLKIGVREWTIERAKDILEGREGVDGILKAARKLEVHISRDITPLEIRQEEKID